MYRRLTPILTAIAIAGTSFSIGGLMVTPAQAGKKVLCQYYAEFDEGRYVTSSAKHRKGSVACKRAYNRCERRLVRALKKYETGRPIKGCTRA